MRYLIMSFCLTIVISCQTDRNTKKEEIENLKKTNDSLMDILAKIENKYIFDSISFREIPDPKNTAKLNSEYGLELLVVGYSTRESYFVKYDTIVNGKKINPDTLKQSNGGYKYSKKLKNKLNPIRIEMNIINDYGKSKKGILYDVIKAY